MLICCWLVQKILRVCKMRQCRSRRTQCPEVRQYMRVRAWWFCSLLSKLGCDVIVVTWDRRRGITTWSVWWGVQPPTLPWKWYVAQPCWKWTQQAPIHLSLAGGWRWLTLWCKRGYKSLELHWLQWFHDSFMMRRFWRTPMPACWEKRRDSQWSQTGWPCQSFVIAELRLQNKSKAWKTSQ